MCSCSEKFENILKHIWNTKAQPSFPNWQYYWLQQSALSIIYSYTRLEKVEGEEEECSDSFQFKLPSCSDPAGVVHFEVQTQEYLES